MNTLPPMEQYETNIMLPLNSPKLSQGVSKDAQGNSFIDSNNRPYNLFDIVNEYSWTLTPKDKRQNVPSITLTEYEQDIATLYAQLSYWANGVGFKVDIVNASSPYANLYHAKKTGTVFTFPYFETYDHQINQNWETSKGLMEFSGFEKLAAFASNVAKMLGAAPGTKINQPKVWQGVSPASYTVTFTLFNTIRDEDIWKNVEFKKRLQMSTLHDQRNILLASPPAIFEVDIPGIRYSPAAIISGLTVNNVGQMNKMNGYNIPDAYEFNIIITELISESRQILNDADKSPHLITAITSNDNTLKEYEPVKPAKKDAYGQVGGTATKRERFDTLVKPEHKGQDMSIPLGKSGF